MTVSLPFARAWDMILHNANLTPTEKIVLIEVCRYHPRGYSGANATIAHNTGLSVRTVQYALKSLSTGKNTRSKQGKFKRRPYIDREYKHYYVAKKLHTVRTLYPIAMPGPLYPPKHKLRKQWACCDTRLSVSKTSQGCKNSTPPRDPCTPIKT